MRPVIDLMDIGVYPTRTDLQTKYGYLKKHLLYNLFSTTYDGLITSVINQTGPWSVRLKAEVEEECDQ